MSKIFTLLKATKSDLNIFNASIKSKINQKGRMGKLLVMILLVMILLFSVGVYAYIFGEALNKANHIEYLLAIFSTVATLAIFIMSITKSQGMLFKCKDDELLFSLPISKREIFAYRIIQHILLQYIWVLIIMIPAIFVYQLFAITNVLTYFVILLQLIVLPIVPTVLGSAIGYIICLISSKSKKSHIMQLIVSFIFFSAIMVLSFTTGGVIEQIEENAKMAETIYLNITSTYPVSRLFAQNLVAINMPSLLTIILVPVIFFGIVVYIFGASYFKIISKLKSKHTGAKYNKEKIKQSSGVEALTKKEIKRYFASSIWVLNTLLGPIMLLLASIYVAFTNVEQLIIQNNLQDILAYIPHILVFGMCFFISTSSTTSSSISMEGKSLWLLKQLPVKAEEIFKAKIFANIIEILPLTVIGLSIILVKLSISSVITLELLVLASVMLAFVSVMGIYINLKCPNVNGSEMQIVKQSTASFLGIFGNMTILAILAGLTIAVIPLDISYTMAIYILILGILTYLMWCYLKKKGAEILRKINN